MDDCCTALKDQDFANVFSLQKVLWKRAPGWSKDEVMANGGENLMVSFLHSNSSRHGVFKQTDAGC